MRVNGYECDVCRLQRGKDANNWFIITVGSPEIMHRPWHGATSEAIDSADYHVCGAEHLLKKISELIAGKKTLEAV